MTAVIQVEGLRKRHREVTAVDGIGFEVAEREVFGIVGPNGAGKTTTVEIVEGLRRPDGGRVRVLGLDPGRDGPRLRQRIGAQLQKAALPDRLKDAPRAELFRAVRAAARGETVLAPEVATRLVGQLREPTAQPLTQRELRVLELVARGATNREVATRLQVSEATVKTHLVHAFGKLGVSDRTAAVTAALERRLIRLDG
jgi:DNA-binding CsgD family transcriptional regulator